MEKIDFGEYFWQNDKIRLRAMEEKDWEDYFLDRFDSSARRLLNYEVELPPTEKEAMEFVEKFSDYSNPDGRIMLAIETRQGEKVGGINLNSIDEKNGTFSIGMLIYKNYRGKGYGTSAMRIILGYAFYERRLNKYYGSVIETNQASRRMLEKIGCRQEGKRKQMIFTQGRYQDEILFGLTREEFDGQNLEKE